MSVTLITGGMRSGKSRYAENLTRQRAGDGPATYVATGRRADGTDAEWATRIQIHQQRRPSSWTTIESRDLRTALRDGDGPVLVDCLGTWITGLIDEAGLWDDLSAARELLRDKGAELVDLLSHSERDIIVVSNEVGASLVPLEPSGRLFVDELGSLNAAISAVADHVYLVVAGRALDLAAAQVVR